jgi:hypothetical protein
VETGIGLPRPEQTQQGWAENDAGNNFPNNHWLTYFGNKKGEKS